MPFALKWSHVVLPEGSRVALHCSCTAGGTSEHPKGAQMKARCGDSVAASHSLPTSGCRGLRVDQREHLVSRWCHLDGEHSYSSPLKLLQWGHSWTVLNSALSVLLKYKKPPSQQLLFAERKFCEMQPRDSQKTENANAFTNLTEVSFLKSRFDYQK